MIRQSILLIFLLWLGQNAINPDSVFGQQPEQSAWQATVECDSLVVYSQMYTQSRVVGHLKKGDQVKIDLEIIGSSGSWSSVRSPGGRERLGFVRSGCLRRRHKPVIQWEAQSITPAEMRPRPESAQAADISRQKAPTREEIELEIDRRVAARLNALISPTGISQTESPEPLWLGDRASFPFVPGFGGVPFGFFPRRFPHSMMPFPTNPSPFHRSLGPRFIPSVQIHPGSTTPRK